MQKNTKIQVAIAGGTGYTAGELLRLLLRHPGVQITHVTSTSNPGLKIHSIHRDLLGETEICFDDGSRLTDTDVLFLCLGHGLSETFLTEHEIPASCHVIDLGADFRLRRHQTCHGRTFVYGLPEARSHPETYRQELRKAGNVANPGCFATAIQLALLPLAAAGLIQKDVHVTALTGATGAGRSLQESSHFAWRHDNISAYEVFTHRHLPEIRQTLGCVQTLAQGPELPPIRFVPLRGNFSRGIFASLYTACALDAQEAEACYTSYYREHLFVHYSRKAPALKEVVNTNKCFLYAQSHGDMLYMNAVIDNLLKGAAGNAVHNMNLLMGWPAQTGLMLKPSGF